ncbi:hypothetical protein AUF78_15740 [archaeon 13_1_20CM_2_51_12]|nr:MAG: hypothetical protein AUF78_15740 [archaeon 13_1_20CM_2_51_12]
MAADAPFLVLLILHVGAIVSWMGGAAVYTSVIIPSMAKMSPSSRTEFIQSALPRYLRFIGGSAILAIAAGLALYAYITQVATAFAPSNLGSPYVNAGVVVGLILLIIAFGIMIPSGRKLVLLVKKAPQAEPPANDPTLAQIAKLQKRMGIAGRLGLALLGIALILMLVGASI